ncbi:ABC transporter substrate-binding protein [Kocuria sp. CNJ-770]|uniref:aliphatic sulfonate ABC transporter substrate-binding protein n=1 Tax=Kocuria sp. CNJ-770 TaxID=1904964 RepID=UPI0009656099|nr:aliphatic sulfonate ABC transporter substrate-binding protein [Kocuria sp. CNJ-770]OLT08227.1 ABC transporter substrate-binding protein [Kocuria sp. CNJ-770]
MPLSPRPARTIPALAAVLALSLTGCMAGEGSGGAQAAEKITVDWATYNPLSVVIKEKGWLEAAFAEEGTEVEWVQSAGSNKANEALRAEAVDVGSTAGSAALLARSNDTPIKVIDLYSQPEWSALVTTPGTGVESVADLEGRTVAATKGTDPYFFLLQALEEGGVDPADVTIQNLQHADGRSALENGQVDAWAGLDPIMAAAEQNGAELFYRNVDFNTYGFLNAHENFLEEQPEAAQTVVDVYAYARDWALAHPEETAQLLADAAGIELSVAEQVLERTHLDIDHVPGEQQLAVLEKVGPIFVDSGDVSGQEQIDEALAGLVESSYAEDADAARVAEAAEGAEAGQ